MYTRILFFIFIGFISWKSSYGQDVYFGARAGVNYTNLLNAHTHSKPRIGFQGGLLGMVSLTRTAEKWFLQPEVHYSNQGEYSEPISPDGTRVKQKIFLNYINIPIQAKYYFERVDRGFFLEGGPYVGFLIRKNIEELNFPNDAENETTTGFDFGLMGGVGYALNARLEISLRGMYGLRNQINSPLHSKTINNAVLNLGISYILDFDRLGNGSCF